jgi:hypothetical protein
MANEIKKIETENVKMKEKLVDMQCRTMKYNLIAILVLMLASSFLSFLSFSKSFDNLSVFSFASSNKFPVPWELASKSATLDFTCTISVSAVITLQCRTMKYNLIFTGLDEQADENCENKLRHFIYQEMKIPERIELFLEVFR